ncbi:hypothetical protein Moror_8637 [Moniliophthora roreri MCA 2997]|uniref:Uncharacterized protein n=2 Tax=Moniliophthora roreri TaxID=221103 RepID=V2WS22_MONRO|nr:hypothetical protein Moror_8637 [Moniliophthora roreri MCA 2997]KAI3601147.1 hypothetical protein WG66_001666 [Moniliophthora roreri]
MVTAAAGRFRFCLEPQPPSPISLNTQISQQPRLRIAMNGKVYLMAMSNGLPSGCTDISQSREDNQFSKELPGKSMVRIKDDWVSGKWDPGRAHEESFTVSQYPPL